MGKMRPSAFGASAGASALRGAGLERFGFTTAILNVF